MGRTGAGSVRFTTYNTLDLFREESAQAREHYRLVVETIRAIGPDVLAIQEIRAEDEHTARQRLCQLAADVGMACLVPGLAAAGPGPGQAQPGVAGDGGAGRVLPALGFGSHGYHVGLLWRDGIDPLPGSFQSRSRDMWHALAMVTLDVGGRRIRHASYHATPFGRRIRADQSELVVAALARPDTRIPALVGADWNGESADRVPSQESGSRLYEPGDPYHGVKWFEEMVHQCEWGYDRRGRRRHHVDRSAGEALWAGGLHDAAAVLGAPWQATSGHFPGDAFGDRGIMRRIDGVRVTAEVIPALRAHWVTGTALSRSASDHLPVSVEYDPEAVAPGHSRGES